MKRTGKRLFLSATGKALTIVLVIALLPFARNLITLVFPGITGQVTIQSGILEQKLQSTRRLEVTTIEEEGIMEAKTNVIILGTIGKTTIRYRYTASVGIDLSRVIMTPDGDRIVFLIPEPEILNDGIEALEVNKQDLFSRAVDKSTEKLLEEQKNECRNQYLSDPKHNEMIWQSTEKAFEETLREWLSSYGEPGYQFEFCRLNEKKPEESVRLD